MIDQTLFVEIIGSEWRRRVYLDPSEYLSWEIWICTVTVDEDIIQVYACILYDCKERSKVCPPDTQICSIICRRT